VGVFEGLLGGFTGRKSEVEAQNRAEAERAANREAAIFSSLMNADDPEVRSLALAGLLDSAKPRTKKSGLRGWIGEMESSPYMPQIQSLINTPVTEHKQIQLPGEATRPGLPGPIPGMDVVKPTIVTPPAGGAPASAGMSPTPMIDSKTQSAGPPPPQSYTQPPPIPYTVQKPRQVFLSPEAKYEQMELLKGKVGEEVKIRELETILGDRTKAIEFRRREREAEIQYRLRMGAGGAAGMNYAEGEVVPDPSSPTGYVQIMYQRGNPQNQYRMPAAPPTNTTRFFGQDLESIARELYNKPVAQLSQAEIANANTVKQQREVSQAGATTAARGEAAAAAPMTRQDTFAAHQTLANDWQQLATPLREVNRQMLIMDAGMSAANRGDMAAGSDAVQLTFQKILDPISVVRTEEYLRIVGEQSLLDRARGAFERMRIGGTGVPLAELQEYAALAKQIASAMDRGMQIDRVRIARAARSYGLDPSLILDKVPSEAQAPPSSIVSPPPQPGGAATTSAAPPVNGPPAPGGNGYAVGEEVMYDGKRHKVIAIRPDGQVDLEVIP